MIGSLICRTFLGEMERVVVDADRCALRDGGGCARGVVDEDADATLEVLQDADPAATNDDAECASVPMEFVGCGAAAGVGGVAESLLSVNEIVEVVVVALVDLVTVVEGVSGGKFASSVIARGVDEPLLEETLIVCRRGLTAVVAAPAPSSFGICSRFKEDIMEEAARGLKIKTPPPVIPSSSNVSFFSLPPPPPSLPPPPAHDSLSALCRLNVALEVVEGRFLMRVSYEVRL